jgi:mannonate dehydratase
MEAVEESVRRYMSEGYRHIRVQMSVPGQSTYGSSGGRGRGGDVAAERDNNRISVWEPKAYCRLLPKLFEHL